jgi:ABC-type phosphate transport system substrate-binding protein
MTVRRALLLLLAAGAAAPLAGCGIDTSKQGKPDAGSSTTPGKTSTVISDRARKLPKRPAGVVEVRGPEQGSLTPAAIPGVTGVRVNLITESGQQGITDLCAGRIDVLDISRTLTRAELRACARNGVDVADPIQIASDAIVIATPNESDVGGDCLRMSTVNDIFRAGSPLTNWDQVGFFSVPMRVTGPQENSPAFRFFAQSVFDIPLNASLADFRSDYIAHRSDNGVRFEVTSAARVKRVRQRYAGRIEDLTIERQLALQESIDRALARTRKRVLDQFAREDARRAATRVTLTPTQKALIARRNRRVIIRALRASQAAAIRRFSFPPLTFLKARYRAALKRARLKGTIGIFRFSYYELFEQQLRPMEIWDPEIAAQALEDMNGVRVVHDATAPAAGAGTSTSTTSTTSTSTTATTTTSTTTTPAGDSKDDVVVNADRTPWCVFPSQQTITNGSYPLSRRLLLYVSRLNLRRKEVQAFLTSYLQRAQQLASANRLVPVPDDVIERNQRIISGDTTPGVQTSTSPGTTTTTTTATTPQNVPGVGRGPATTTTTQTTTTP